MINQPPVCQFSWCKYSHHGLIQAAVCHHLEEVHIAHLASKIKTIEDGVLILPSFCGLFKYKWKPDTVLDAYDFSPYEAKAGGLPWVQHQPGHIMSYSPVWAHEWDTQVCPLTSHECTPHIHTRDEINSNLKRKTKNGYHWRLRLQHNKVWWDANIQTIPIFKARLTK